VKPTLEAEAVTGSNHDSEGGEGPMQIRWDGIVGETAMPLPGIDAALRNVSRQSALAAPAKVALSLSGTAVLLVEVPESRDRERATDAIGAALDAATIWMNGDGAAVHEATAQCKNAEESREVDTLRWIEETLGTLEWTHERDDRGAIRVTGSSADGVARIAPIAHGAVRVWHEARLLRATAPRVEEAVRLFALEANARFRLARLSIGARDDGAGSKVVFGVWETVVLPDVGGAQWLRQAVEALAVADAETRRALRALTDAVIAEAYIAARDPRHGKDAA
jgi:hypothetical protein